PANSSCMTGVPRRGFVIAPTGVVLSCRDRRTVPPTITATAATAHSATITRTRRLTTGASVARNRAGTVFRAMPTYRELLAPLRSEIDEVDAVRARELLAADDPPLLVDIREFDEWAEGKIPGAIHIPRGNLESRIENAAP